MWMWLRGSANAAVLRGAKPREASRHRGLDFYRVHRFELEVAEQGVRGDAGADADDRHAPRVGLDRERQRRRQRHRGFVRERRPVQVDAAVGLAVGADRAAVGEIDEAHARPCGRPGSRASFASCGVKSCPWRNTPDIIRCVSSSTAESIAPSAAATSATAATSRRVSAEHGPQQDEPEADVDRRAQRASVPFSPSSGRPTCAARNTPTMAPSVLAA